MSELSCAATASHPRDARLGTVGKLLPGLEGKIADDGEYLVRGPLVMKGYRKEPAKTAEAIDADGWLHTGDIFDVDAQGYLRVVDRKKELIINAAGKNMSPANIENTILAACPMVGVMIAIGDGRPYNTALMVFDADSVGPYAARHGLSDASPAALAADPEVIARIAAGVAEGNAKLSRVEQIKRFRILPTLWEPGGDEITLTMKLKRKPIFAKYAAEIEDLYQRGQHPEVHEPFEAEQLRRLRSRNGATGVSRGRVATCAELGRTGVRKLLQRTGIVDESVTPLSTDPAEVVQLLGASWYEERLQKLAAELGRDPESVRAEAAGYLREMAASLDERAVEAWRGFSRWLMRAYDVLVDEDQIAALRKLDRKATLAFAFSHRSYLDGTLLPEVIVANRLTPALTFGGSNLNFFPMGAWAKHTGTIFIRRQTKDIPVYRFALRAYTAQLVQNHANLTWSIEGGRTRTGKLRPPVFGILRYITDAVDEIDGPEVYLVPTSIVYDQLHEVEAMTTEAYGADKRPEDLRFLVRLARQQGERLGRAYLDFGEPLPLRKRLEELRAGNRAPGPKSNASHWTWNTGSTAPRRSPLPRW